jgi:tripartite-type tricarboxylate transporter receptor subunit TctC
MNLDLDKVRILAAGVVLCIPVHGASAAEAAYPTRPIRLIVPFVAGGGTDLLARLLTPHLNDRLGQQIVVDNRGGGGSVVGTQILVKSPPDGYTLGLFDTAFVINPSVLEKLPYDSERDFTFIAIIATSPSLLVAHPGLKVRTVQELIAVAKKRPGKITYASAGVGSSNHLTGAMLNAAAGINLLHVPYKGAGAAIVDVVGGHADLTFVVPGSVMQHIQAGTLIPLAISGKRSPSYLPDVPTFASVGLAAVNPESFRFMTAPNGLPSSIQKKIVTSLAAVMSMQDLKVRLAENGFDAEFLPDEAARAFVVKELSKWRRAVKLSGAKAN